MPFEQPSLSPQEEQENFELKDLWIDDLNVPDVKVVLDDDGFVAEFLEDIDSEHPSLKSEAVLESLISIGIFTDEDGNSGQSYYELTDDGSNGILIIKKEDINRAISEQKIRIKSDPEGDIEIV